GGALGGALRRRAARRRAGGADLAAALGELGLQFGELALDRLDRLVGADELVAPRPAGLSVREHQRDRAAVLALQALEQREPLLDLVQPPGWRLDALGVAVQLLQQVLP